MSKTKRKANVELFRIVSMIMVILLHALAESGILFRSDKLSISYIVLWTLEGICMIAVDCYVLISGYFLIKSKFRIKKLLILLGECSFYSTIIYISSILFGQAEFGFFDLLKNVFPVISNQYWFVTTYVGLYILSPVLNLGILALGREKHFLAVIILMLLCSVYPSFIFWGTDFQVNSGYSLIWFICLYVLSAWVRLYYSQEYRKRRLIIYYVITALSVPASRFLIDFLSEGRLEGDMFYSYSSILVWPAALLLFLIFLNIQIRPGVWSGIIIRAAANTFAVYLLHQNHFISSWLWSVLKLNNMELSTAGNLFWIFLCVMIIFCVGVLIEEIRKWLFNPIDNSIFLEKVCLFLETKYSQLENRLKKQS